MQNYEFSYTITPTGARVTFEIPDPGEDSYGAEVARAVYNALTRVTNLSNVTANLVTTVRSVTRGNVPAQ